MTSLELSDITYALRLADETLRTGIICGIYEATEARKQRCLRLRRLHTKLTEKRSEDT